MCDSALMPSANPMIGSGVSISAFSMPSRPAKKMSVDSSPNTSDATAAVLNGRYSKSSPRTGARRGGEALIVAMETFRNVGSQIAD